MEETKYEVYSKHYYENKMIENFGEMTIDEIRNFAKRFIGVDCSKNGVVFTNDESIEKDIKYIQENGSELWLVGNNVEIVINRLER